MSNLDLTTEDGVSAYLKNTQIPCLKATRLADGVSAFVYRVELGKPLEGGSRTLIAKHAKDYAAGAYQLKLDRSRLAYEFQAFSHVQYALDKPGYKCPVRLPRAIRFDEDASVLLVEDVGALTTLKAWLTHDKNLATVKSIGSALGNFLADLHDRTALMEHFSSNWAGRHLSGVLYYGGLAAAAAKFGHTEAFIKQAAENAQEEVQREGTEGDRVMTMGDFWPGNILVDESHREPQDGQPGLFSVDWELSKPGTAEFDIGQMAAEMHCLMRYRDPANGAMLLQSFLQAYGQRRSVSPAKVAIRMGAHHVIIGPMVWTEIAGQDGVKALVEDGVHLIKAGWEKDTELLKASVLSPLYPGS